MDFLRQARYALETVFVCVAYGFFWLLPLETASNIGGWVGRHLGPRLPSSDVARRNLAAAFPDKTPEAREKIVVGMWDNLGRIMAEYPHLPRIWKNISSEGDEYTRAARDSGKPVIICTGHLGNWEIIPVYTKNNGLNMCPVYRKPNNPGVARLLHYARGASAATLIAKGAGGAREMLSVLKKNGCLGILNDQKLNEGMPIPFFGRDAMTAPAVARFALHFKCPIYLLRVERLEGAHFKVTVYPPMAVSRPGNDEQNMRATLTEINRVMEGWIRERPEQWLWTHRRWPD